IEVGARESVVWREAFGRLRFASDAAATTSDTIFDLASLTKVIATTSLVMRASDDGRLALDDRVADRLPEWRGPDRARVTVADLLEHASGLTAYRPFFRDQRGRAEFERAICALPLEYEPRTRSIYSDLGFILLAFMLEDLHRTPFAAMFDACWAGLKPRAAGSQRPREVGAAGIEALRGDDLLLFNPPRELHEPCAPTELDVWRGRLLQGEVHDENAWALAGAAGHAGLFGTAAAVGRFARSMLQGLSGLETIARSDTIERFVRKSDVPGSSRALGWDTMLQSSSCGTRLSARAIGHTGFTGTSLWLDPARDLYVVLLTNRVHPTRENDQIQDVRRRVHDAVVTALE
ncbi:MAG TPA: serine hydrolase domain-containing protein, partial [Vicinamibacterales bacterium]